MERRQPLAAARDSLAHNWTGRHLSRPITRREAESMIGPGDAVYRDRYVRPLLELLLGWLRSGEAAHADVYVAERQRFVPLGDAAPDGRAEVAALVREDVDELLALAPPAERERLEERLARLHAPLLADAPSRTVEMLLVGDCVMNEIRAAVTSGARDHGIDLHAHHLYFSASLGVELSTREIESFVENNRVDLIALSFMTFEGIPPYAALLADSGRLGSAETERRVDALFGLVRGYVEGVRSLTNATILLHGVCGLPLDRVRRRLPFVPPMSRGRRRMLSLLNARLRELAAHTENALFLDEWAIVEEHGARTAARPVFDRSLTRDALFHTSNFGLLAAREYVDVIRSYADLGRTKVLLVDFDNTLWRGVMAEGAVEHDVRAQRLLKELKDAGVLLVSVSKNDPGSIRWDEMALGYDDFVLHKVSWNQKVQSIEETAQQLDLGLDTLVLIDDSPVERSFVEQALPAVTTLDPLAAGTWESLARLLEFPATRRTAEAARRTELYREAAKRREALAGSHDLGEMMRSADLRAELREARRADLDRVHELVARTNQFNTTTRRRSRGELAALLDDPEHGLYVATLADRFGDLGVVGVTIVARRGGERVFDSVIMSCRAMGFGLELVLVRMPLEAEGEWERAVGLFQATERNGPAAGLFANAGFRLDGNVWVLDSELDLPEVPDWLHVASQARSAG